jgi:hypothetical protein
MLYLLSPAFFSRLCIRPIVIPLTIFSYPFLYEISAGTYRWPFGFQRHMSHPARVSQSRVIWLSLTVENDVNSLVSVRSRKPFGLWDYRHCGQSWPIVPASGDNEDDCGEHDGSRLAGETEVLGENLPRRHFCLSQNPTCPPVFVPGPPRWEAGD